MKILCLILAIFSLNSYSAERVEELEQFEIRSYSPHKSGIKDLVYEVRVDGLKDIIEKNLVVGKLVDLYFKVYWINSGEMRVTVEGLPQGFKEVKEDLKQLIKGKLDFVIPEKIGDRLKQYTIKVESIPDGKILKAIDETYTLAIPEIDLLFDKNNRLKNIETKLTPNSLSTEFFHSVKAWSNNKLVLDKVISKSGVDGNRLTVINEIEYGNINGLGLPSKILVKNISEFTIKASEKDKPSIQKKETTSTFRFSKYEVNTGKALKYIGQETPVK